MRALDNFEVMLGQFGVRNGIRVVEVSSRNPWRLAWAGVRAGPCPLGCGRIPPSSGAIDGARARRDGWQRLGKSKSVCRLTQHLR